MKKQKLLKLTILCSIFSTLFSAYAQQANVTSGGNATGTGGTSSYSVGQVAYTNATGTSGSINQGVQQPYEIFPLGTDNFPEIVATLSVYPNPTPNFITLSIQNLELKNVSFQLFDVNGRQIQSQKISTIDTQIQMENLESAMYILYVSDSNKILKSFKIIKNAL